VVLEVEPPTITGIQLQEGNVLLSFMTQDGAHYAIDCSETLVTGSWTAIMTDITGNGGVVTASNFDVATAPRRFYRVRLTSP